MLPLWGPEAHAPGKELAGAHLAPGVTCASRCWGGCAVTPWDSASGLGSLAGHRDLFWNGAGGQMVTEPGCSTDCTRARVGGGCTCSQHMPELLGSHTQAPDVWMDGRTVPSRPSVAGPHCVGRMLRARGQILLLLPWQLREEGAAPQLGKQAPPRGSRGGEEPVEVLEQQVLREQGPGPVATAGTRPCCLWKILLRPFHLSP